MKLYLTITFGHSFFTMTKSTGVFCEKNKKLYLSTIYTKQHIFGKM